MTLNLPGKDPIEVKDRDHLKKSIFEIAQKIGGAEADAQIKVKKLQQLFAVNEETLNGIGPDIYLDVKNKINDIIRSLLT